MSMEEFFNQFYEFLEQSESVFDNGTRERLRRERENFLNWAKANRRRVSDEMLFNLLFSWIEAGRLCGELRNYARTLDATVQSLNTFADRLDAFAKESEAEKMHTEFCSYVRGRARSLRKCAEEIGERAKLLRERSGMHASEEFSLSAETFSLIRATSGVVRETRRAFETAEEEKNIVKNIYAKILVPFREAWRSLQALLDFRKDNYELLSFVDGKKDRVEFLIRERNDCVAELYKSDTEKWRRKTAERVQALKGYIDREREKEENLIRGKIAAFGAQIRVRKPVIAVRAEDHPETEYFVDWRGVRMLPPDGVRTAAVTVRSLDAGLNRADGLPIALSLSALKTAGLIAPDVGFAVVLDNGYMPETGPKNARIPKFTADAAEGIAFDPRAFRNLFGTPADVHTEQEG